MGNPAAVNSLRAWARQWQDGVPEQRVVVLTGSPGVGKTTSAEALAREMGWGIVEMNASDQRTAADIERIALGGAVNNTFTDDGHFLRASDGGRKLIVLDEADNFFGNADRGASTAVSSLLRGTSQPVMLIVNDLYGLTRKIPAVKDRTLQITFKKPQTGTVARALQGIAEAEGVRVDLLTLELIAENAAGDMRAAVRNLESLALGQAEVTAEMAEELSPRDSRSDIFALMGAIFRGGDPARARSVGFDVDEEPRDVLSWVDENLPQEMPDPGDLVRGYDRLSRADIFLGRVASRQYYGFWSYARDLMTFGVCASRQSRARGSSRMNFPGIARKMSSAKRARALRDSVCLKLAMHLHTTSHRVQTDVLPYIRGIMANDEAIRAPLTEAMGLEPEELAFLIGKKADSKAVTSVYDGIDRAREERILSGLGRTRSGDAPAPAATAPGVGHDDEPPAEDPKQTRAKQPKGQLSLFDFR